MSTIQKCKECEYIPCDGSGFGEDGDYYPTQDCFINLKAENERLRKAMEWISVNDRLPTTSAPVMVTLGSRVVATSFYNQHLGVWYYWEGITHWQPLPLPPEPTDE